MDTTTTHNDWTLTGASWTQLLELTRRGLVELAVPLVVLMEGARQHLEHIEAVHKKLSGLADEFTDHRRRLLDAGMDQPSGPVTAFWEAPGRAAHVFAIRRRVESAGGRVLPIPIVDHVDLLDRDLDRILPFQASGKGYRDSLIWLSFVRAAQACVPEQAIYFVTDNTRDYPVTHSQAPADFPDLPNHVAARTRILKSLGALLEDAPMRVLLDTMRDSERSGSATQPPKKALVWFQGSAPDGDATEATLDAAWAMISVADGIAGRPVKLRKSGGSGPDFTTIRVPAGIYNAQVDHFIPFPYSAKWEVYSTTKHALLIQATMLTDVLLEGVMDEADYYSYASSGLMNVVDVELTEHINDNQVSVTWGDTLILTFRAVADPENAIVMSLELDHARPATTAEKAEVSETDLAAAYN